MEIVICLEGISLVSCEAGNAWKQTEVMSSLITQTIAPRRCQIYIFIALTQQIMRSYPSGGFSVSVYLSSKAKQHKGVLDIHEINYLFMGEGEGEGVEEGGS